MNNSKLYLSYNHAQRADAQSILSELCHHFRWNYDGDDSLLDIGCGPGDVLLDFIVPVMPKKFYKVVGVDLSSEMIEFSRGKCLSEKISFYQMDISDEFEKCKKNIFDEQLKLFNNITSFCCLHWIQNQRYSRNSLEDVWIFEVFVICSLLIQIIFNDIYDCVRNLRSIN